MLSDGLSLVGRERELARVREFLADDAAGPMALVLEGPPGIGKTCIWEAGLEAARGQGMLVLSSRPSNADAALDFAGLSDVFVGIELDGLPAPQRRALEVALLLREGDGAGDSRAVFTAVRTTLDGLARGAKVVVAIDDVQWLDRATASALAFAARRLGGGAVRFLLTERVQEASRATSPLAAGDRLTITPLSYGAIITLLHERLGVALTRPVARRVYEISGGNPLFALELGRAVSAPGAPAFSDQRELPLPDRIQDALADRVASLSAPARRALIAASLSPTVSVAELVSIVGTGGLESAVDGGVLVQEDARVRPSHPLLGEVAKAGADAGAVRSLHRRMAAAIHDDERRALHLSLGTLGEDSSIANVVGSAADAAARRGASGTAADLGARAVALTPRSDPAWTERLLDAAEYSYFAGELARAARLLEPEIDHLPPGPQQARALFLLAVAGPFDARDVYVTFERALEAASEPTLVRAKILTYFARDIAVGQVHAPAEAEARAREAIEISRRAADPEQERHALVSLMWATALAGRPIDELLERYYALSDRQLSTYNSAERVAAITKLWRGELAPARAQFEALLALAEERGEIEGHFAIRLQLCELELRAARWDRVSEFLDEWAQEHGEMVGHKPAFLRCSAFVALGRGDATEAIRLAEATITTGSRADVRWHRLEALRARGVAELLAGDPRAAAESLGQVEQHLRAQGIANPGAFPVAPDLAEALASVGDADSARDVAETLRVRAAEQSNPWAAAAAVRAAGHVALAQRDDSRARELFADAATRFAELGLDFDQARALVGLGVAQRRLRTKRDARTSFEQAIAAFERLGSPGWAASATAEMAQLGGRVSSGGQLTPTERRVVELVAEGMANKQVAAALVVSDRTVEAHLTRIYAKLGVRSRIELARWFSDSR